METVKRDRRAPAVGAVALGVFALLVVAAPLAFGAVDRVCQIGVVVLLAIGVWLRPPTVARPRPRTNALIITGLALLLFQEFAPAAWFGTTYWRTTLAESFGLAFPWTHHPEPARALDALLAGAVGVVWFLWVRTLAIDRKNRPVLAWSLLASGAVVAAVSYATRGIDPNAIYGLRFTPGWFGFGPFPNRNHTACLLAMSFIMGAGCVASAGARRRRGLVVCGLGLMGLVLAALLTTQSRGGLLIAIAGIGIFLGCVVLRFRSRRAVGFALGTGLVSLAIGLAFGGQVLARFASKEGGDVSNHMRVAVWKDTLRLWNDAPLFGHGLQSFTQVFPMYQAIETGGRPVLHPESSWLQWLSELGVVPVVFGVVGLLMLVVPGVRQMFAAERGFFLRAAGFAAAAALLIHALFDVPAHRWGTAGFALAALALVCTPAEGTRLVRPNQKAVLVPLGIAAFWALPFFGDAPAWSPLSLARLIARERATVLMPASELESSIRYFHLCAELHQAAGIRELAAPPMQGGMDWQGHFRIALRLQPGSWYVAADQAQACERLAPVFALHYWQLAVERAERRVDEVFRIAFEQTARRPGAADAWAQYVESHPALLLTYAEIVPPDLARAAYDRWWTERGSKIGEAPDWEAAIFYRLAARFGNPRQIEAWMNGHAALRDRDATTWATLLHGWGEDELAWSALAASIPDSEFPTGSPRAGRDMEGRWLSDPHDFVNARDYAQSLQVSGDTDGARNVIVAVAQGDDAPQWFVRKAAHLLAERRRYREAVELLIVARAPR